MRSLHAASRRIDRRRQLLRGAAAAVALGAALLLPLTLHAQSTGAPPGQPIPEPAPEGAARPVATAPPSTDQPLLLQPAPGAATPLAAPQPPAVPANPAGPGAVAPNPKYIVSPTYFASPPVIDGRLDDAVWKTAARISGFTQLELHEGAPATERTEIYLGYDDNNLYVAAHCYDSQPDKIVTTSLTHDSDVSYDDSLTILLDTYHDGRTAYLFTTNSGGVQVDALVRNEGEEVNLDWDGIWSVEGKRDATGWTVEIAIPFSSLHFPSRPDQVWGFNVERDIARKHEKSFWKPVVHSWSARYKLGTAGTLVGMRGAKPGKRYHIIPYTLLGAQKLAGHSTEAVTQVGGDIKIDVSSDLVADLTVKTDFSEAEADAEAVNLTRNALLFPEKRAFFLEGASLFYMGERPDPEHAAETFLFFSRQIGLTPNGSAAIPLLGGVKLYGHEGDWDIGALSIETAATHHPDGYGGLVIAPQTDWSVVRLQRDLPGGSSFGIIGLAKEATGDNNEVAGADWDIALNKYLRSGGYFAKSDTPSVKSNDWLGSTDLLWDSRNARIHWELTEIGKGFNDELGFLSRVDERELWSDNYWILWPEKGPFKQAWFIYDLDYIETLSTEEMQTRINHISFNAYFHNGAGISLKNYDETEVLTVPFEIKHDLFVPPGIYHFNHSFFGFQTDYTQPVGAAGRLAWGDYYDGHYLQYFAFVTYRPIPGLATDLTFQETQVVLKEGSFTDDLLLAEFTHAFTHLLSATAWVQWERGLNLHQKYDVEWEFRPGSKLFLIYEDIRTDVNYFDPQQPTFGYPGRSLLAKVQYQF